MLVVGASWVLEKAANECLGSLCMSGPVERTGCCWWMHIGGKALVGGRLLVVGDACKVR